MSTGNVDDLTILLNPEVTCLVECLDDDVEARILLDDLVSVFIHVKAVHEDQGRVGRVLSRTKSTSQTGPGMADLSVQGSQTQAY